MGANQISISNLQLQKGEGYRIINIRKNSPFQKHVDLFFDFIIDVSPSKQPQKNNTQNIISNQPIKKTKKLQQLLVQHQNQSLTLKIVSTKYRKIRTIQITPNKIWNGVNDVSGITTRIQKYNQVFQTYFQFADIKINSPIHKSGVKQGQYLIACLQFIYQSINQFTQHLYSRYFDKNIQDKHINLAIYNLINDQIRIVSVLLVRGWGGKGLLGCQFLQGYLNKFPKNLQQARLNLLNKIKKTQQNTRIQKQLSQCNAASLQFVQNLNQHKNKYKKNIKNIKKILLNEQIQQPNNTQLKLKSLQQSTHISSSQQSNIINSQQCSNQYVPIAKFKQLQQRVILLQTTLTKMKQIISKTQKYDQDL